MSLNQALIAPAQERPNKRIQPTRGKRRVQGVGRGARG